MKSNFNKEAKEILNNIVKQNESSIDKEIRKIMRKYSVVGLQALAVLKGKVVWSSSYGFQNITSKKLMTEETQFRIASISKLFTATAVMQLTEDNKVDLDEDISTYLGFLIRNPHFPKMKITLRQLLTHTSSLNSDDVNGSVYARFIASSQTEKVPNLKEIFLEDGRFYNKLIWGEWKPGANEFWTYSNLGSILIAAIIEKISGKRFDHYIIDNLFEPLEIKNAAFSYPKNEQIGNLATLYEWDEQSNKYLVTIDGSKHQKNLNWTNYIPGLNGGMFNPQGGLYISAKELSHFMIAHMQNGRYKNHRILNEHTAKMMKAVHWKSDNLKRFFTKMGLQFHISSDFLSQYPNMIGHSGEAYGLLSDMYWEEEKEFGIIFMMNGSRFDSTVPTRFNVEVELASAIYNNIILGVI